MTITSRGDRDAAGIPDNHKLNFMDFTSKMTKNDYITYSSLAPEERSILSLMKRIDYGRLEHLAIRDGRIIKTQNSRMVQSIRFDAKNTERKSDDDFLLTEKQTKFLDDVRRLSNAIINTIQIQAGLPVSMEIAKGF